LLRDWLSKSGTAANLYFVKLLKYVRLAHLFNEFDVAGVEVARQKDLTGASAAAHIEPVGILLGATVLARLHRTLGGYNIRSDIIGLLVEVLCQQLHRVVGDDVGDFQ